MSECWYSVQDYPAWVDLQNTFEQMFIARGAPDDWALFERRVPGGKGESEIALCAPERSLPLFTSPGGWSRREIEGDGWAQLVGHADAHEKFGVQIGKN